MSVPYMDARMHRKIQVLEVIVLYLEEDMTVTEGLPQGCVTPLQNLPYSSRRTV